MNSSRTTSQVETARASRARSRAARAQVANYIHELSTRHNARAERRRVAPAPTLRPCEA